ncbi:hypothetical protein AAVH_42337 [Aphelenchoides avenae]|nr:hypothetical protein AAVH_42337 [Aphelenchus avenae]
MDEDLLDKLLPVSRSWKNGRCTAPKQFASLGVFERTFNELLFCDKLRIGPTTEVAMQKAFMSFACVQRCRRLKTTAGSGELGQHVRLDVNELLTWLHRDGGSETRPIELETTEKNVVLSALLNDMMQNFTEATKATRYVVRIACEVPWSSLAKCGISEPRSIENKSTSESMDIGVEGDFIYVQRELNL